MVRLNELVEKTPVFPSILTNVIQYLQADMFFLNHLNALLLSNLLESTFFHKRRVLSVIIFRYLTKEILTTLLATTLLLLVLFVTNQSLQFLQRAALGQIPATEILHIIILQIPLFLGYLLPLGLYLGVLLTLGRMQLDSEMTVLSACGVSCAKLTGMILIIAFFVSLIVTGLMAVVVPQAQGDTNVIMDTAAVTASVGQVIPNRFMVFQKKNENPIVFYAASVTHHAILHNVFLAQKLKNKQGTDDKKWSVIVAQSVSEKKLRGQAGRYLIFNHGYRYVGEPGEKDYQVMQFNQYGLRTLVNDIPNDNAAQYYSFSKLWKLRTTDKKSAAELQWRMAMPISTMLFALLAVPLSEVRPRYGKFTQLFPAMLIYLGYGDLIFLTRSWMRFGRVSSAWGMWWVHGAILLLAIILMLYRLGWRRMKGIIT